MGVVVVGLAEARGVRARSKCRGWMLVGSRSTLLVTLSGCLSRGIDGMFVVVAGRMSTEKMKESRRLR